MRLLCLPYFQETGGTHRFSGRGKKLRAPAILALKRGDASANRSIISAVLMLFRPYANNGIKCIWRYESPFPRAALACSFHR